MSISIHKLAAKYAINLMCISENIICCLAMASIHVLNEIAGKLRATAISHGPFGTQNKTK